MPTAYDVPSDLLISKITEELKKEAEIKAPEWAVYAKTGVHKENSPVQEDWWYIRAASILRKIYLYGPIGVSRLRVAYGGRHRRGVKPEHFALILKQEALATALDKVDICIINRGYSNHMGDSGA